MGCGNAGAGQATVGAPAPESSLATRTGSTDATSTACAPCVQAHRHRPDLQQSEACSPAAGAGMAAGCAPAGVARACCAWHGMSVSAAVAELRARGASASTSAATCTDPAAAAAPLTASNRLSRTRSRTDQADMHPFYRPDPARWTRDRQASPRNSDR